MKIFNQLIVFGLLFLVFQSCENSKTPQATTELSDNNPTRAVPVKEDNLHSEPTINPLQLFKAKALSELLKFEMEEMEFIETKSALLHTFFDIDKDGDEDLIIQAFFQKEDLVKDVFLIYLNDKKINKGKEFSFNLYYLLDSKNGEIDESKPCESCIFKSRENDLFVFLDKKTNKEFTLKIIPSKYGIKEWQKQ